MLLSYVRSGPMDDQRRLDKLFSAEYADDLNKVSRSDILQIFIFEIWKCSIACVSWRGRTGRGFLFILDRYILFIFCNVYEITHDIKYVHEIY